MNVVVITTDNKTSREKINDLPFIVVNVSKLHLIDLERCYIVAFDEMSDEDKTLISRKLPNALIYPNVTYMISYFKLLIKELTRWLSDDYQLESLYDILSLYGITKENGINYSVELDNLSFKLIPKNAKSELIFELLNCLNS